MIIGSALFVIAGVLAALAVRSADRAKLVRRAGSTGEEPCVRARWRPLLPGPRWWPVAGAALGWPLGGVIAASLGALLAFAAASIAERRRTARLAAKVDEQLADAVRSIAAGLRAGLSVSQAIAYAAREGEPPLSDAFQRVTDAVDLGEGLDDTLARWAAEVGTDDARLVVGVLALHRKSGGDLPRVLDQVAQTLRERTSAAQEVRALTAQARLSGAILGLLPIGFFGFLWVTSRGDVEGAFRSSVGIAAMAIGLTLEGVAFLWIRRLLEVV